MEPHQPLGRTPHLLGDTPKVAVAALAPTRGAATLRHTVLCVSGVRCRRPRRAPAMVQHHEASCYDADEFCWRGYLWAHPGPPRRGARKKGARCGGVLAGPTSRVRARTPREGEAPSRLHGGAGRYLMPASRRSSAFFYENTQTSCPDRRTPPPGLPSPFSHAARRACLLVVPPCPRRAVCVCCVARAGSTGMSPLGLKP